MVANPAATPKREVGSSAAERFPPIFRGWYPVCFAEELPPRRPRSVVVYGREFVVYRTGAGALAGLLDRCPHRNVPLSLGRVCEDDAIECPYHGWKFASDGSCRHVPGLTVVPSEVRATTTQVAESGGIVWIWAEPSCPPEKLLPLPESAFDASYGTVRRTVRVPASLFRTAENALDVPHTSTLHRGLFRSGSRQQLSVRVRRWRDRVEAEYEGERPPKGALGWVLSLGSPRQQRQLTVQHWDRFLLPATIQVEYRLGLAVHFMITAFARPVSAELTELVVVASYKTPFPRNLVQLLLEPLANRVFRQDQRMLGLQTLAFRRQGAPAYYSTALDTLGQEMWRLLKARSADEQPGALSARGPAEGAADDAVADHRFELWA